MPPDESLSRIPPARRRTNFVSQGENLRSSQDFPLRRVRQGEPRRKGRRRQAKPVKVSKEWAIGGGLLLLVAVAVAGLWIAGRMTSKPLPETAGSLAAPDDGYSRPPAKWQGPIPSEVADSFVAARTHEARLRWVRNPRQAGPLMKAFFEDGPGASEKVLSIRAMPATVSGDLLYEEFQVDIDGKPGRLLSVSIDPAGAKVDFESYARHGSASWEDLISGKVAEAEEIRVMLQMSGYYLHGFSDERKWQHFKATTPDLQEGLDFYVERGSPAAADLHLNPPAACRATLSIRSVNGSSAHRQFEITGVKAMSWAEPE